MHAKRPPEPVAAKEQAYLINEQIRYSEVRVVGEVTDDPKSSEVLDMNEVMVTSEALARAKSRGLDLVMVNENSDPPLVKIVNVGKYTYQEEKRAKEKARQVKAPKMKEVRVGYTIGDHDLNVKLRQVSKWMDNKRQQVKVVVQMKGRSRMFEKQARQLMDRIQKEVAPYAKAAASAKTGEAYSKDGQGNIMMMLSSGADIQLLKKLKEEGAFDLEDDGEDEDDVVTKGKKGGDEPSSPELAELQEELEEVKQDLLDCGISPGALSQQPEFVDVLQRIEEAKAKIAGGALRGRAGPPMASGTMRAASFALAAASLAVVSRRPRTAQARGHSSR